jgi:hypothetical protein
MNSIHIYFLQGFITLYFSNSFTTKHFRIEIQVVDYYKSTVNSNYGLVR